MDFNMDFNSVITSSELESSYASNTEIRFIIVSTMNKHRHNCCGSKLFSRFRNTLIHDFLINQELLVCLLRKAFQHFSQLMFRICTPFCHEGSGYQ